MSIYYPQCDINVPDPSCSDCPTKELGSIRSVFFVKDSFTFTDITDVSEWTTGITNGDIKVFPYTRGTLEQNEVESAGFGDQETTLDAYEFVLNFQEPQYQLNWSFWNAIKSSQEWKVGYRTETQVHLSDNTSRVIPKAPVSDDKKTQVSWQIMCKWSQEDLMRPYDMPVSVFNQCINI